MTSNSHYTDRKLNLADMLPGIPVLLLSGCDRYRNYPSYPFPFRATSHYMFFGGPNEPNNFLLILNGDATLYRPTPHADDEIWHGPRESNEELQARYDLKEIKTHDQLPDDLSTLGLEEVLSLPSPDSGSNEFLKSFLGRVPNLDDDPDVDLVDAMMELRRCQDEKAQQSIREAVEATVAVQKSVMAACAPGRTERELRGVLDKELASHGLGASFQPIISIAGEVLHNPHYKNTLSAEDLLLVDCGAEVGDGYVGDLTRTYPVDGRFSQTQKAIYDIVDAARARAVSMVAPGAHFADLHKAASLVMAEGLVELGILKGEPEKLVEEGVHALFFCHGLGHLMGLDAHDMEDFGDRIGYEEGTERSAQFGLSNLRLSRELEPGMVVTIEPGYYRVPALLDGELAKSFEANLDRDVLARYSDVRGIRIEDVVLVTEDGYENLSSSLPTSSEDITKLVGSAQVAGAV
jgi:Xaa-Pro aminopeptidase